jgi:large conductance mechanosensitive channel
MSLVSDFKEFAFKGNVIDMAVGVIIGAAFGGVVKSLVDDVIMPPIGTLTGNVDFGNKFSVLKEGAKVAGPYPTLADAKAAGAVVMSWGVFVNTVIQFLIVAIAVFMMVRVFQKLKKEEKKVEAPAGPTEVELLTSIRDLLKKDAGDDKKKAEKA